MNLNFLYRYLVSPFETTATSITSYSPRLEGLAVLLLLGVTQGARLGGHFFIVFGFLFALLGAFLVFVQTLVFDFTAQALGRPANTVRLFYWLALSGTPLLLKLPLALVQGMSMSLNFFVVLITFGLSCFCACLQIFTIKTLYQMSLKRSLFVYFIPIIAVVGVVGLLVLVTSFFSIMLIKGL